MMASNGSPALCVSQSFAAHKTLSGLALDDATNARDEKLVSQLCLDSLREMGLVWVALAAGVDVLSGIGSHQS